MTSIPQKKSERELHELLEHVDLLEYYDKFIEIGADNVQQLCDLTDEAFGEVADLVEMTRKPLHVKRFRKALEQWKGHTGTCGSGTSTRETATAACTEQAK
ncbi:NGFI-A-binding protein 1-like [Ornithodoros turicata]|uniref:NGFI-A-binding protein 1-like n=1 Tax=Ornithodoros turicata TaxID=34597 RepID=UPI003138A0EF